MSGFLSRNFANFYYSKYCKLANKIVSIHFRLEKEYLAKRTKEQEEAIELRVSSFFFLTL